MILCEYQYRLSLGKKMRESGSVEIRISQCGRKSVTSQIDLQNIELDCYNVNLVFSCH